MTSIALFGAGGKMGHRLSRNLKDSAFTLRHVEVSEQGRARLAQDFGVQCVSPEVALADAQVRRLDAAFRQIVAHADLAAATADVKALGLDGS